MHPCPQPGQLTQEFTPLKAENWQADMKLYVKTCSNLQTLSVKAKKTLMKRYVSTAMWPLVEVGRGDDMAMMIKKVVEAYNRLNPTFNRKVQFLDMMIMRGESYISWMNRINQQAKLADLENIRAQEIQLMKCCQGLNKTDRLYEKLMELEVPSCARAQEIIKKTCPEYCPKGCAGGLGSQDCPRTDAESDVRKRRSQTHKPVSRRTEKEI